MRKSLFLGLLFLYQVVSAQVVTQFVPEINGRTVDALLQTKYLNAAQSTVSGTITVLVKEVRKGNILLIRIPDVVLNPGTNLLPHHLMKGINIHFYENEMAKLVAQTNRFPAGEYEYCFSFASQHGQLNNEECFDQLIEPVMPLLLMEPYHQSEICEQKPDFYWQPMMPSIPGTHYQLNLAELKDGQSPQEALIYNLPVIQQQGINTPLLIYPPNVEALAEGKTYVWQVSAINTATVLTRSEIWQFTVKCTPDQTISSPNSYRSIDDLAKGSFYIASPFLNFSLYNPYSAVDLKYEIKPLRDSKTTLKNLPKIKLVTGVNKIQINLEDVKGIKSEEFYLLIVNFPMNQKKELRFVYHEQNN